MHSRRKRVVRRLRHIHIVIRMNRLLAAQNAGGDLNRAVRDHLIRVHIGLRAAAGLPDVQWEVLIQFSGDHFICGLHDQLGLFRRELAQILVHQRRGLFQDSEGTY